MLTKEKVAVIIGPTASGKTDLSIFAAKQLNGEVISGDSMQIYRGLDIGTAKVTTSEMDGVPHHLIDIKNVDESFSAAEFQQLAREKITDINARGKLPIICGGTGLYIQSVLYDYQFAQNGNDETIRKQLEEEAESLGADALHEKLRKVDPASADAIHPNNVRRTIRALEVYSTTGRPASEQQSTEKPDEKYDSAIAGLTMDRSVLYERINKRVDIMMEAGLLAEAKMLYELGLKDVPAVQAIGYKELFGYLKGEQPLEEAVELLKQNSRRYAKRQLTWFRNKMDLEWVDVTDEALRHEKKQQICEWLAGKLNLR
ncbi:tRNA (adenosine(37)-N6)-dimethylallyltransferase MiaA [Domibacillus epiphyticus]|uniref:tRNA dimethylallyltransferase n=1 Tax=Domibacillus epiphyticus TaxID=1714355 RepID=A0A1V2ACG8_9BACI|nr:tRNA (adenosine(37)-N6)-dimethylallyltransferase MiaA [Domibacillus epiphyticus]OMP68679.1 tRNA (adenosine(37)-N6)-dimethylallyltransferase MiaA [Domibacillus epiphyticus]